jgi:hypothetical protein
LIEKGERDWGDRAAPQQDAAFLRPGRRDGWQPREDGPHCPRRGPQRHRLGIESSERIDPGFVWFKDRVGGHKYGVLTWSRKCGERYRAGITFVTLSRTDELYVPDQVRHSPPLDRFQDPLQVIEAIIASVRKDAGGNN